MTDVYGYRLKVGVVTPSVNTVVQPEYDDMRPVGVTNHLARIHVPNLSTPDSSALHQSVSDLDAGVDDAVERVLTCEPDVVALGVSIEAVYGHGSGWCTPETRSRLRCRPMGSPVAPSRSSPPTGCRGSRISVRS